MWLGCSAEKRGSVRSKLEVAELPDYKYYGVETLWVKKSFLKILGSKCFLVVLVEQHVSRWLLIQCPQQPGSFCFWSTWAYGALSDSWIPWWHCLTCNPYTSLICILSIVPAFPWPCSPQLQPAHHFLSIWNCLQWHLVMLRLRNGSSSTPIYFLFPEILFQVQHHSFHAFMFPSVSKGLWQAFLSINYWFSKLLILTPKYLPSLLKYLSPFFPPRNPTYEKEVLVTCLLA